MGFTSPANPIVDDVAMSQAALFLCLELMHNVLPTMRVECERVSQKRLHNNIGWSLCSARINPMEFASTSMKRSNAASIEYVLSSAEPFLGGQKICEVSDHGNK